MPGAGDPGPSPAPESRALIIAILLLAAVGLYLGWRLFWFMTDDAFIAFRYVSNSRLGYGYVWNPPPFRPVQGYTSFLWVVLLDVVSRTLGVEPPESSTVLSLLFAAGTLALTSAMVLRLPSTPDLQRCRPFLLALALLGILTNRTFLAWTSSGLETTLFDFLLILWVFVALFISSAVTGWLWYLTTTTALLFLARPDGLVFVAGTIVLAIIFVTRQSRDVESRGRILLGAIPLLLVAVELIWQRARYGSWTPNTYTAKVVAAWPESGIRYLLSFVMEYFLWTWLVVMMLVLWRWAGEVIRSGHVKSCFRKAWLLPRANRIIVVAALGLHFLYYTFIVGGDHFEYRVYNHLIPLLFVSFICALDWLRLTPARAISTLGLLVLLSWPIPWVHFFLTKDLTTREQTLILIQPVAPSFPRVVRWYPAAFDVLQKWLIQHSVGMRHQEHKVFQQLQASKYPPRDERRANFEDGIPVLSLGTVGIPGWVFPHMAIIDRRGLNDLVIARTPITNGRMMAHDRRPPAEYIGCFQPNVRVVGREVLIAPREKPLTAEDIRACEARFLD